MRIYRVSKKDKVTGKWSYDLYSDVMVARPMFEIAVHSNDNTEVLLEGLDDTTGKFLVTKTFDSFKGLTRRKFYPVWVESYRRNTATWAHDTHILELMWVADVPSAVSLLHETYKRVCEQKGVEPGNISKMTQGTFVNPDGPIGYRVRRAMVYEDKLTESFVIRKYCEDKGLNREGYINAVKASK